MPAQVTTATLRAFLKSDLAIDDPVADDEELFSAGVLDSVAMMALIAFLEEQTGGDVRPSDVTLDNFDTLDRIAAYAATLV